MYRTPIDAYMLRRTGDALTATPVQLTNVRPDSYLAACDALANNRIAFVAPAIFADIVAALYPAHADDLAAAMDTRTPHEVTVTPAGVTARCLVEAM